MIKEACVEGFVEAIKAQELGADRIELCENLSAGGTTPSLGTIKMCVSRLHIPVVVMIRPRSGNFIYTEDELEIMRQDIKACKEAGAYGIAIGILTTNHSIDLENLQKLKKDCGDLQITFHKAIDVTHNLENEFKRLRDSGLVQRVLTSGGSKDAKEGAGMLKKMIQWSDNSMSIVVAGKVTRDNLPLLSVMIPAKEFHGKKIVGDLR
jgi:copper homeostasis protein